MQSQNLGRSVDSSHPASTLNLFLITDCRVSHDTGLATVIDHTLSTMFVNTVSIEALPLRWVKHKAGRCPIPSDD
jgi:hypothetical protein